LFVTGVTYRHPGLLAKIVTTVDVLSGGRAGLGIGVAWSEREHRGLGVPFPAVGSPARWIDAMAPAVPPLADLG
jgi:alkanesulfonate monooxygenase SsuD/methylene tetrahydromethanopterin reductase-like flavin-dependent oxidoreductase (luciferase family)